MSSPAELPVDPDLAAGRAWDVGPVLEVWVDPESDPVTIVMAGALTAESAAQVQLSLAQVTPGGERDVLVDLRSVDVVDPAGVEVLAGALRRSAGTRYQLVSPDGAAGLSSPEHHWSVDWAVEAGRGWCR